MSVLTKRQKVLLLVVDALEKCGKNTKTFIMKTLFLLKHDFHADEKMRFYSFFPYKYGPFSEAVYSDLNYMANHGLITDAQTSLTAEGRRLVSSIKLLHEQAELIARKYSSQDDLLADVYERYPKFAVKSKLVKRTGPRKEPAILATGYEGEDIDEFLNKLIKSQIDIVVDIRNNPFSMKFSFTKNRLARHLERTGIAYVHIKELGVEKELRENLQTGEDYQKLFLAYKVKLAQSQDMVLELLQLSEGHRVALLCFERSPQQCHRSVLAEELENRGKRVIFV